MATISRVQTGVRLEMRLLNVLKALAALKGLSLGDLLEGIVLHAFDGEQAFSPQTLTQIADLKRVYGLDLAAADSHQLVETSGPASKRARAVKAVKAGKSASRKGRK
jgi:predicted DNA-binding ribbon-helix-helix protein